MSGTVMPPTSAIKSAGTLLEDAIERLIGAWAGCRTLGEYEAEVEAFNLLKLIIRHVESVVALSARDLVLLPSAMVVARAAYEATVRLLWMVDPDDPFQREVRWLAHLQTEERYYMNMAKQLARFGSGEAERKRAVAIGQIRSEIENKLPEGHVTLKQLPNLYQMLESLGEARKYMMYVIASQFAHATHEAVGLYRKNLGTARVIGEYIAPEDWAICFAMSWYSLHASGERFLERAGGNPRDFLSAEFGGRVQAAINALGRER